MKTMVDHGPRDIRFEGVDDPAAKADTDAIAPLARPWWWSGAGR